MTPAQEQLITSHLDIPKIALRKLGFTNRPDWQDLLAAGRLGLVQAATTYRDDRGATFRTWANLRVRGAILDELRATQFGSRSAHDRPIAIARARHKLGDHATELELAAELGWTVAQVRTAITDNTQTILLPLDARWFDNAMPDSGPLPGDALIDAATAAELADAVSHLRPRLRRVIHARFVEQLPMADLAAEFGVTQSRISQLQNEALRTLRRLLTASTEVAA